MVQNWSDRVEELLDEGDSDGAVRFLEGIVEEMRSSQGANQNLSLAVAMEDLGALYERQGLSLKADSLRSSAIVIRRNDASRIDAGKEVNVDDDEEDWEKAAIDTLPSSSSTKLPSPPDPSSQFSQLSLDEEAPPKRRGRGSSNYRREDSLVDDDQVPRQRGRGAFTYGKNGFHSDLAVSLDRSHDELSTTSSDDRNVVVYGASHVLVLSGFSPKTTTRDLEQLVESFSSRGVVIRWINDTTALAVFRNPATAREALSSIRHPSMELKTYEDSSEIHGLVSEKDLEPPTQRPATSARAAQRMIVGALANQGIVRRGQAKVKFTAQELQTQEEERKQRLLAREKLREEAWGGD